MICKLCSGPLQPAAKFCGRCGTPVSGSGAPEPRADRRVVTILMARAVETASAAPASGMAADAAGQRAPRAGDAFDAFWQAAVRAISRMGGVVAQHSRDRVLAVFGIPTTRAHDAERAVRAAAEALAELRRLAGAEPELAMPGLGIGLATGMVVASETAGPGMGGDGGRQAGFGVAGDAVLLARMLSEAAAAGDVLADEETQRATCHVFRFVPVEPGIGGGSAAAIPLPDGPSPGSESPSEDESLARSESPQGRDSPDGTEPRVYRLAGRRSLTGRTGSLEDPLIGRDSELAEIKAGWQRAAAGAPTIMAVVGDAGMGKTALLRKFLVGPALEGAQVRRVRCQSYQQDAPYALAGNLLLTLLGLPVDAEPASVAPALAGFVADLLPGMPDAATLLGRILGLQGEEAASASQGLLPNQARTAAFLAFGDLLVALSRRKPLVVVVEDLQWADEASLTWIDPLVRRLLAESAAPVLAILSGRPESGFAAVLEAITRAGSIRPAAETPGPGAHRIDLPPLADSDAMALASYHLGSTPEALPWRIRQILGETVQRAAGNPYFLSEMVRSLERSGILARRGATWELESAPAGWRLPTTVHAAVAARIDLLSAAHRRVVEAAAVLGRRFDRALLGAVLRSDAEIAGVVDDVDALLGDLIEQGIFEESASTAGSREMAFSQPLIQEVAYGSLVEERRRDLHRRVGLALEAKIGPSTVRFSPTLAQHFAQAEDPERAARYFAKAGDRARAAYANVEARACYRAALEWRGRAGESATLPPREDLLLNLALVETSLGHYDEALGLLDRRQELVPETPRSLRARGDVLERKGELAGALAAYRAAIVLAGNDGLETSRAMASQANVRRRLGDFPEAIQMCRTALACLAGMGMPAEAAYVHGVMGICHQRMGELEEALREHSEALRLREEAGDVEGVASSLNNLGIVSAWAGHLEAAADYYRRSLELYRRLSDRASIGDVLNNLGDLRIKQGRIAEAEGHLHEALSIARSLGHTPTTIVVLGNLADAALGRGDAASALRLLEEAIDLVYQTGHAEVMAEVRLLRGRALALLGRAQEASAELGEARSLAASAGHLGLFEEVERQARELGLDPAPKTG